MKRILFLMSAILFITACDEKDVNLYPSFNESIKVLIKEQGSINESGLMSSSDINKEIDNLDLDESGTIKSVNVEGIWIVVEELGDNTAQSLSLSIGIRDWNGGMEYIVESYTLVIPTTKTTINLPEYLKTDGVNELKDQLSSVIVDGVLKDIQFDVEGIASPSGSVIHIELEIVVKGAVVFSQTI